MDNIMENKGQEYIDHTLLPPEYIRETNNFIIDLINFPKATTNGDVNNVVVDALPPDLHFSNALFNENAEPNGSSTNNNQINNDHRKSSHAVYMPMSDDATFLAMPSTEPLQTAEDNKTVKLVQQLLITESNVDSNENSTDNQCDVIRYNSRKVLPHKKRISRKLKIVPSEPDMSINVSLDGQKSHKTLMHAERLVMGTKVRFHCELCGQGARTQLEFYTHLKEHYEPSTPDTILAAMKTSLDVLGPEKAENGNEMHSIHRKTEADSNELDQVFRDVHFPFDNFAQNQPPVGHHDNGAIVSEQSSPSHIIIKEDKSNLTNDNHLPASPVPPSVPTSVTAVEEFSEAEDMLEGIRDKVFIEDTCDTMDLITPPSTHDLRPNWFSNSCFSGMDLKAKPFCDVLFNGTFQPLLTNDSHSSISVLNGGDEKMTASSKTSVISTTVNTPSDSKCIINRDDDHNNDDNNDNDDNISLQLTNGDDNLCNDGILMSQPNKTESPSLMVPIKMTNKQEEEEEEEEEVEDEDDGDAIEEDDISETDEVKDEKQFIMWSVKGDSGIIIDSGQKKFVCKKCLRIFNSCNALKYHNRTHSGLRPHQCDVCARQFFALGALKAHMRTHTGAKPYQCEHCDKRFRQFGDLKYHNTSIHSTEKAFTCEFCGKSFSRKYSLVVHVRIHTSEYNYKCEWCDKSFRASSYLQNHRKIHTGEKPYQCDICPKRFRISGDLKRHKCIHEKQRLKSSKKPE